MEGIRACRVLPANLIQHMQCGDNCTHGTPSELTHLWHLKIDRQINRKGHFTAAHMSSNVVACIEARHPAAQGRRPTNTACAAAPDEFDGRASSAARVRVRAVTNAAKMDGKMPWVRHKDLSKERPAGITSCLPLAA
eukprot:1162065-Pelagomonas_calceolata.AAC.5